MGWIATPASARPIADLLVATGLRNAGYRYVVLEKGAVVEPGLAEYLQSRELVLCVGAGQAGCPAYKRIDDSGTNVFEFRSQITLRAMSTEPMLVAYDLRKATPEILSILLNREVIALHQDPLGRTGERLLKDGDSEVWVKPLADGGQAVALLNRGETMREVSTLVPYPSRLVELWLRRDVRMPREEFTAMVPPHGVILLRAVPMRGPDLR